MLSGLLNLGWLGSYGDSKEREQTRWQTNEKFNSKKNEERKKRNQKKKNQHDQPEHANAKNTYSSSSERRRSTAFS